MKNKRNGSIPSKKRNIHETWLIFYYQRRKNDNGIVLKISQLIGRTEPKWIVSVAKIGRCHLLDENKIKTFGFLIVLKIKRHYRLHHVKRSAMLLHGLLIHSIDCMKNCGIWKQLLEL